MEHVAEGQENNRGTSQGCSRGGEGTIKNFTISEAQGRRRFVGYKGIEGGFQGTLVIG